MGKVGKNAINEVDKYTFLATAAAGKDVSAEEINYVPSLNVDVMNIRCISTTLLEGPSATVLGNLDAGFDVADHPHESSPELRPNLSESEVGTLVGSEVNVAAMSASPRNDKPKSNILDLFPRLDEHNEAAEVDTDENESTCERSSSSCDVADDNVAGPSLGHCIGGWKSDNDDTLKVVFNPEYVVYCNSYYTDPVIYFTSDFIEMEGSTTDGNDQTYRYKWEIEDIVNIRSHRSDQLEMVMIHVLTKDTLQVETIERTSGIELKFPVIGSSFDGRLEAIMSLNVEYKALWNILHESDDTVVGYTGVSESKYLPDFDQPNEEVVYPKGDADAVSISKRDFDLLLPDTFVNDTIIDFYIKHLKNKIKPEEKHRFHFFNSFFFRKLADPDKDSLDASQGRVAYQRVKKWTRKVNLFEKDFVFIPVNYNYHWSLILICHLAEVATYKDANESIKVPCVLHMDSFRGSHTGLKGLVQSYLKEEWIERKQVSSEDICSRFDNLKFISLELPQQPNLYDCGLFLLHYVELFLEQAPLHFNPFKITNGSKFLNVDWFHPTEACLKRGVIQRLICKLLNNEEQCHLSLQTNFNNFNVSNLPEEGCNPIMPHQNTHVFHDIGISLTTSSSVHGVDDFTLTTKSSCKSGSFLDSPFPTFNQSTTFDTYNGSLSPIKENEEDIEQFVDTQPVSGIQQGDDIIPASPNLSQDLKTQELWQPPANDHESSREASTSGCEDSIEIVNENNQLDFEFSLKNNIVEDDESRSPVLDTLSEYVEMVDGNGDDPVSSFGLSNMQKVNGSTTGSENCSGVELDVQHPPTKKIRMTEI